MDKTAEEFLSKISEMTGKSPDELESLYRQSKLTKHSEIRAMFMEKLQLSYGFANTLTHLVAKTDGASQAEGKELPALLDEIYAGKKEVLRPIHDKIMHEVEQFGDFEILPKKGYLSLKRRRQFAMIGPKTNARVEVGINIKGRPGTARLVEQPKGSMCSFIVSLESIQEADAELTGWLKEAYEQSV